MEKILESLKRKKWQKLGRWKIAPTIVIAAAEGHANPNLPYILPYIPTEIVVADNGWFVEGEEFKHQGLLTKADFEKDSKKLTNQFGEIITQNAEVLLQISKETPSIENISRILHHVVLANRNWYSIMIADEALQALIFSSLPDLFSLKDKNFTRETFFAEVALPKKLFPIIEERQHILEIAIQLKLGVEIKDLLNKHTEKFGWMNSLAWYSPLFTADDYRKEVEELLKGDPAVELRKMLTDREQQQTKANSLLAELKEIYPMAWNWIDIIRDLADLKEENWDAVSIAGARIRPYLEMKAKENNLTYDQLISVIPEELPQILAGTMKTNVEALNSRMEKQLVISSSGKVEVESGDIVQQALSILEGETTAARELKGMPVWPGVVRGVVRVLHSMDEVSTMKKGEVLVCPMTDPDYMPAIHKSAAIVTDQGGVLCHAAIVARELQKTCVVGTQKATKIFKTGDKIEVDANKGIVRKLND